MDTAVTPIEFRTHPPPLYRPGALVPRHLDVYARNRHQYGDRREALLRSVMTNSQADRADAAAEALVVQRGIAPWRLDRLRHARAVVPPPRNLQGTKALFSLLDGVPDPSLVRLSNAWAMQAHLPRLVESDVLMVLNSGELMEAADKILTATGIDAQRIQRDGRAMLVTARTVRRAKGHAAGLRWVLGLVWIYQRVIGDP